mgnify:CR=1 FL=1
MKGKTISKYLNIFLAAIVMSSALSIASCRELDGKADEKYVAARSGLNLRAEASVKSAKLLTIPYGARLKILKASKSKVTIEGLHGRWVQTEYKGKLGWVFDGLLSSQPGKIISSKPNKSTKPTKYDLSMELSKALCSRDKFDYEHGLALIEKGADVNFVHGVPIIHCVAASCDLEKIKYLISKGANVNARITYSRVTPIFWFKVRSCKNYPELVEYFLSQGAKIDKLMMDTESNYNMPEKIKQLLASHAEENQNERFLALSQYGDSPDYYEKIKRMVEDGIDVNYQSMASGGTTALMMAAAYCNRRTIHLLVEKGAKINLVDNHGESVFFHLHDEANAGYENECTYDVLRYLIEKGGDINKRNFIGESAATRFPRLNK